MIAAMGVFKQRRAGDRRARRKRGRIVKSALLIALLALAGALLDPSLIAPFGPTAMRPERISARFTRCGQEPGTACVVDGDTFRLGQRRVRLIGIDAPELAGARCAAERALGERAADRLLTLLTKASSTSSGTASATATVTAVTSASRFAAVCRSGTNSPAKVLPGVIMGRS